LPTVNDHNAATAPQAMTGVAPEIQKMTCAEMDQDFERLAQQDAFLEQGIHAHRTKNQAASYLSGFLLTPIVAEHDEEAKALLDQNQNRRDQLIVALRANHCSTTY